MIKLGIEYLKDEDIIPYGINFIQTYNSGKIIPVPIEKIIEFDLDINIIP